MIPAPLSPRSTGDNMIEGFDLDQEEALLVAAADPVASQRAWDIAVGEHEASQDAHLAWWQSVQ